MRKTTYEYKVPICPTEKLYVQDILVYESDILLTLNQLYNQVTNILSAKEELKGYIIHPYYWSELEKKYYFRQLLYCR